VVLKELVVLLKVANIYAGYIAEGREVLHQSSSVIDVF